MVYIYKPKQILHNRLLTWSVLYYDLDRHIWNYKYCTSYQEIYTFYNNYHKKLKNIQNSSESDKTLLQRRQLALKIYQETMEHIK